MRFLYLEPATDWTDQIVEERLRMCAETLFIHDLINDRTYHLATTKLRDRADIQRERRAATVGTPGTCILPGACPNELG